MFISFVLTMREGLEAALIVGLVISVLVKTKSGHLIPSVVWGVATALIVSLVGAVLLGNLGASLQAGVEEVFEGLMMLTAAGLLTWMIFWMQRRGQMMQHALEGQVLEVVSRKRAGGLFALAFFAVVREGVETALLLTVTAFQFSERDVWIGGMLGLTAAALLGWGIFASAIRLNLRRFFQVTGGLLLLFAAGLIGHGVRELIVVSWIPPLMNPVWDLNPILSETSTLGIFLGVLFGYNGNPTLMEVLVYLAYLLTVTLGLQAFRNPYQQKALSK